MTSTDARPLPEARLADVRVLSDLLPRFVRVIHALKNQTAKTDGSDRAALVLLFPLAYFSVQLMRWWSKILSLSQKPAFKRART